MSVSESACLGPDALGTHTHTLHNTCKVVIALGNYYYCLRRIIAHTQRQQSKDGMQVAAIWQHIHTTRLCVACARDPKFAYFASFSLVVITIHALDL